MRNDGRKGEMRGERGGGVIERKRHEGPKVHKKEHSSRSTGGRVTASGSEWAGKERIFFSAVHFNSVLRSQPV